MAKLKKTNAMRRLDQAGIDYEVHDRDHLDQVMAPIYKTLVTQGKSGDNYVFVVAIDHVLDLKLAAQAVGEKSIHMIKERDLFPLTGYVHGGCSPLAMKKLFPTHIDVSAQAYPTILVSGGQVGISIELPPQSLAEIVPASFASIQTNHER